VPSHVFFRAENAPKPFSAEALPRTQLGELTTLPQTNSRLKRGHPLPIPLLLDALGFSILAHPMKNRFRVAELLKC